jgi:hypothetical protein
MILVAEFGIPQGLPKGQGSDEGKPWVVFSEVFYCMGIKDPCLRGSL